MQNRTKEKRYTFDVAYDTAARNNDVYTGTIQDLAAGVSRGLNATVVAYGATGSGKTHTMVGACMCLSQCAACCAAGRLVSV